MKVAYLTPYPPKVDGIGAHAAEIDAALSSGAFTNQPIVLYGSDGHTAWANKAARIRAGIKAQ